MKIVSIIKKGIKEQIRNFWMLLLTVSMAPFFVVIFFLINQSTEQHYKVLVVNNDKGYQKKNYANEMLMHLSDRNKKMMTVTTTSNKEDGLQQLKSKEADLLLVLPEDFSQQLNLINDSNLFKSINIEYAGDLTSTNYMIAAIWVSDFLTNYILSSTTIKNPISFKETALGSSGTISAFDLSMPGLFVFSLVMLMFTVAIAIVNETEKQTIKRLKLSKLSTIEFFGAITFVQVLVGFVCIAFTLVTAMFFGFEFRGSFSLVFLIVLLCSVSIIAFGLLIAAFCKSVNQVLIVGNFPLFLFMFFTGSMFPINTPAFFKITDYSISYNAILSPTHAISALHKVIIFQEGFSAIWPELLILVLITIVYFVLGLWALNKKQLKTH